MSSSHVNQRVGVFVDIQNLYYSAIRHYNSKVDYNRILKDSVGPRKLIRAFAYVIKADVGEEDTFFEALENMGFEVRMKDLQIFVDGKKKGDWDVGLAMDAARMAPKLDAVVLVSGDGDYIDLLQYLRSQGCRVEVVAFGKSTSAKLIETADQFTDSDGKNEYLRTKRNPKRVKRDPKRVKKTGKRKPRNTRK